MDNSNILSVYLNKFSLRVEKVYLREYYISEVIIMEKQLNGKHLVKDLKLCQTVMHDIENKLEDAYLDENVIEMKRCEEALKTLDKEYFQLKTELGEKLRGGRKIMKTTNKHEHEIERDLIYCEKVMHDIEDKLETAYLNEDLIAIRRCEDALRTLDNEFFVLKHEMNEFKH